MLFLRVTEIRIHSSVGFDEKFKGNGDHEQVHLTQVAFLVLFLDLLGHGFGMENRTVVGLKNILADLIEILVKILGVAGEVHAGLALGGGVAFGFE